MTDTTGDTSNPAKGYMLDTNVFNHVADGVIPIEELHSVRLFATHVQLDELNAAKRTERVAALIGVFERLNPNAVVTSSAVWDESKWDEAKWPDEDGILLKVLTRLLELDDERRKTHRDPRNPMRDALIAETALKNGITLVSGDRNLRQVVEEFGGRATELKTLVDRCRENQC
jgi:predicted nucleic acid-binding protein